MEKTLKIINIQRFDKIEFEVLIHTHPDGCGYYPEDPHKTRALLLMEEGILIDNPYDNWWKSGWKLTPKGVEYHDAFLKKLRDKHGHQWKTNRDSNPKHYKNSNSKYADKIDIFALSYGNHNGYECKKCGYSFCMHCLSEFDVKECTKK
jgi:hypothetical protein